MGKSILLVDYDPHSIGRIRRLLRARGYEIHIAKDGLAGIDAFRRIEPALTFVQDLLPKRSGEDVCRVMKDLAFGKEAAVVLVVPACKRSGRGENVPWCDAVLESPFSEELLLELVRQYAGEGDLERTPPSASPPATDSEDADIASRLDRLIDGPQPSQPD